MNLENFKTLGLIIIPLLTVFGVGLMIAGLILGNIFFTLLAVIILIATEPISNIHKDGINKIYQEGNDKIVEDERTRMINEKSAKMTYGIFGSSIAYMCVIIFTLRDSYPQFQQIGYTLALASLFCSILYFASRSYYKKKY